MAEEIIIILLSILCISPLAILIILRVKDYLNKKTKKRAPTAKEYYLKVKEVGAIEAERYFMEKYPGFKMRRLKD